MPEQEPQRSTRVRASRAYARATNRAREYIEEPEKLKSLAAAAGRKAEARSGPLAAIIKPLKDALRLVGAYARGSYRDISWRSLLILVAAVVYFVMPVDLVPDFILGLGLLDDAAILAWTLRTLNQDLERFLAWERGEQDPADPAETPGDNLD
ncbi:YkvA family protein [Haliea sp. E1-2-M8]|uniref:YkvA family protein n=1 Tax=Haliea sp. E1-2-M8 TaxID=3064706 RepID=UPI002722FDB5|nr:YkvA family protein [Haliea sp. E1-2-M8]MDO8860574.1 YkvA family protein [Haliea sp. E1-2-M8]